MLQAACWEVVADHAMHTVQGLPGTLPHAATVLLLCVHNHFGVQLPHSANCSAGGTSSSQSSSASPSSSRYRAGFCCTCMASHSSARRQASHTLRVTCFSSSSCRAQQKVVSRCVITSDSARTTVCVDVVGFMLELALRQIETSPTPECCCY